MATVGKCCPCKIRFEWKYNFPLKGAYCPKCHGLLLRTNRKKKGFKISHAEPLYTRRVEVT